MVVEHAVHLSGQQVLAIGIRRILDIPLATVVRNDTSQDLRHGCG